MLNIDLWNDFVSAAGPRSGAFLESWEWGEFQKILGAKVHRIGDVKEYTANVIQTPLPFGWSYLYVPRGPIVSDQKDFGESLDPLRDLGKKYDTLFVRVEPPIEDGRGPFHSRKTIAIQPKETLLLDLQQSEDELLSLMHPKTRYNIHVAERHGVSVATETDFDAVWPLFEKTGKRGGFHVHPYAHYEHLLRSLKGDGCHAFLAAARFQGQVVAANIMIDFAGTRTYLHGASSDEHREVMASYLLHWQLIQEAKKKGLRWYDWWGIAPEGADKHHAWFGISRFKLGFGGERVKYPGTFDLVLKPVAYQLYQFARKMVRTVR